MNVNPNQHESQRSGARHGESRRPTRTCVGCGLRDDAAELVRLVATDDDVAFDLGGGAFGRGAHLHARPGCIEKACRGLARSFKGAVKIDAAEIGLRLVEACDRRMAGLMLAARRSRVLAIGADAALEALQRGAPLAVIAVDAAGIAQTAEVQRCVASGRAVAWHTRSQLGSLLGEDSVAICAVRHQNIASELKKMRLAADAGAGATREGAECSRFPEAR